MLDIEMTPSEFGEALKNFKPDNWSVTLEYRKRNRMKIGFKLGKEEAEAFVNFKNQTKPDSISEDNFLKSIFFLGLSTLETNISRKIQEEVAAQGEDVVIPDEESEGVSLGVDEESEDVNDASAE